MGSARNTGFWMSAAVVAASTCLSVGAHPALADEIQIQAYQRSGATAPCDSPPTSLQEWRAAWANAADPLSGPSWHPSWAQWANGGQGGYICTRSLTWAWSQSAGPAHFQQPGDVYVAETAGYVAVIDAAGTIVATITVGANPLGVAIAPSGTANAGDVYVANGADGTVSVIDPNNTVIATITVGSHPWNLAVSPTGANAGDVYVTNYNDNTVSVIDPTNTVIATLSVGVSPFGVAVSPTGANAGDVYITNIAGSSVSIIDPTNTVITSVAVGGQPEGIAISPTGANAGTVYVGNYADNTISVIGTDNRVSGTISGALNYPMQLSVSPTGPMAGDIYAIGYYNNFNAFQPNGTDLGNIWPTIPDTVIPRGLPVAASGSQAGDVYVGSYVHGTVTEFDPAGSVVRTINFGSGVQGLAIAP